MRRTAVIACRAAALGWIALAGAAVACARAGAERRVPLQRTITATAYCPCGACNGYTRGHWYWLKLDFWNRIVTVGPRRGEPYTGRTASGAPLRPPQPGLWSLDTLQRPWLAPLRLALPWRWPAREGIIAADTEYYPFGTRMWVPGYGWGTVLDRGSAIRGPDRIDVLMPTHRQALAWGRRTVEVLVFPPPSAAPPPSSSRWP